MNFGNKNHAVKANSSEQIPEQDDTQMIKYSFTINIFAAIIGLGALTACDNTAADIGGSLVEDETEVVEVSDFTLTGQTVANQSVETRDLIQMLGRINAKGYGSMSAEFVTQLMPAAQLSSNLTIENVDSMKLQMFVRNGAYVGDSLAPMGLEVYRLTRQLPANINSEFNVTDYFDPQTGLLASKIYTCNALGASDSIQKLNYRVIDVKLDDNATKALATQLITLYQTNPDAYIFPAIFAKEFPGLYVRNSYGSGRIVEISQTSLNVFYHITTVNADGEEVVKRYSGSYFAVTPEIILNNLLSYDMAAELDGEIAAGETIIVAPIGRDVEITFPIENVINYYNANSGSLAVVNSLSMKIPVEVINNEYGINPPANLLMVLKTDKDKFFSNNELADNVTSFYATYNSKDKCYIFGGLRNYMLEMIKRGKLSSEDFTFVLTPVTVVTESNISNPYYGSTTEYVSSIDQYVGAPAMARLNLNDAEITLKFSKQSVN